MQIRLRFRLRTLLILTALVAAFCYWWVAPPTWMARRFIAAIVAGNVAEADALCIGPDRQFMTHVNESYSRSDRPPSDYEHAAFLVPRDWHDLAHRQQRFIVHQSSEDGIMWQLMFISTASGVLQPPDGPAYAP